MRAGAMLRGLVVAVALAATLDASPARAADAPCSARPAVERFVAALSTGDLETLDDVFAAEGEGWVWYFVNDPAGQRLGAASGRRDTLRAYFAARIRQRESLRVLELRESGDGNFTFVLLRRADDLRGGRAVERQGKGRVSCRTGRLGVWGLGGAPAPASFGPCPGGTLALTAADRRPAAAAVLRFVRDVYAELAPSLDVRDARVVRATPAVGNVLGYTARVRCGRPTQRRTVVVEMRFPHVAPRERAGTAAFYVSRTRRGWLVWRLVR